MDLAELKNRLSFVVDNNDGQVGQAFSTTRLTQAINWAYRQEVLKAQQEGSRKWFLTSTTIIWPTSQVQLVLPEVLKSAEIIRVSNITNSDLGSALIFDETGYFGNAFWANRNTLQWGTSGPSSDITLRFMYYAKPETLVTDDDIPELIPDQFHDLIVWAAAVLLLEIADQRAPEAWYSNRNETRMDLWKYMSRGRPTSDPPRVLDSNLDLDSGIF
jgi:hypothetical protein